MSEEHHCPEWDYVVDNMFGRVHIYGNGKVEELLTYDDECEADPKYAFKYCPYCKSEFK